MRDMRAQRGRQTGRGRAAWLLAIAAMGCAACATVPPAVPTRPAVERDPLEIPLSRQAELDALLRKLEHQIESGACVSLPKVFGDEQAKIETWCSEMGRKNLKQVVIEQQPYFMRGEQLALFLGLIAVHDGGNTAYSHASALVTWKERRIALIDWELDWERVLPGSIVSKTGAVTIDPSAERSFEGDLVIGVKSASEPVIGLQMRTGEGKTRWGIEGVTQDGMPCRFREVGQSLLVVAPVKPGPEIALRIQWGGRAPFASQMDHIRADEFILRPESNWLPGIGDAQVVEHDIVVKVPPDFTVFGQGRRLSREALDSGLEATRWMHKGADFTIYGGRDFKVRSFEMLGTKVELGAADEGRLAKLQNTVTHAMEALAPLGRYPLPELRVTITDFSKGQGGYGALSNITLGTHVADDVAFVTHEVSHGFFPGAVPAAVDDFWPEGIARYLESWAVSASERRSRLATWRRDWEAAPADPNYSPRRPPKTEPWIVRRAYAYDRPALLLCELEDRYGRKAITEALAAFLRDRAGRPSTWDDIVASFAKVVGAEAAADLGRALAASKSGPTVGLRRAGGGTASR